MTTYVEALPSQNKNVQLIGLFKHKDDVEKMRQDQPSSTISHRDAKGMLRNYLNGNKESLEKQLVTVTYYTTDGQVNTVSVVMDPSTYERNLESLMRDPTTTKGLPSGEHNNVLAGRTIKAIGVSIIDIAKLQKKKPTRRPPVLVIQKRRN